MVLGNFNDIAIGPVTIHMYGLMIAIGFLAAYGMCYFRAKKREMDTEVVWDILMAAVIGGLVGTRVLFYIVSIPEILKDPSILWNFKNGYVVYGGIIGGIIASAFVCRKRSVSFLEYFDLVMPSVSLGQAFGRIGCVFAGCCYGQETHSLFHITYTASNFAPNNIALLPTQIISSAGDFVIMILLLIFAKRNEKTGRVGALYLILYSIGRFAIEFFRNDYRGEIAFLSTSQFIACVLFFVGVILFLIFGRDSENRWEGMNHFKA